MYEGIRTIAAFSVASFTLSSFKVSNPRRQIRTVPVAFACLTVPRRICLSRIVRVNSRGNILRVIIIILQHQ